MDVAEIQRQYVRFGSSMYREGYLDEQFTQLQQLADESDPNFVVDVITVFLDDFSRILQNVANAFEEAVIDFNQVTEMVHTLKGSSSSVGAKKMKNLCTTFRNFCEEKMHQECFMCMHQIKEEYIVTKSKFESLVQLEELFQSCKLYHSPKALRERRTSLELVVILDGYINRIIHAKKE